MNSALKTLVVSVGFMIDAYDLFIIGIVLVMMALSYPDAQTDTAETVMALGVLVGTMIGQLGFGFAADWLGRKVMFIATLALIIIFSAASAFAFAIDGKIWISLALFRCLLGIGIGGEYPLSATISAESEDGQKNRGCRMASVFSMQGIGNFLAPFMTFLFLSFGMKVDLAWRFVLGFGAIPPLLTAYHRWKLHVEDHIPVESTEAAHPPGASDPGVVDNSQARPPAKHQKPVVSWKQNWRTFWRYKWVLFGTASTWFLFDITFYANGLFKETIVNILGMKGGETPEIKVRNTALASLTIAAVALPGYWVSIPLVDRIGRKPIQMIGFICITLIFAFMGAFYKQMESTPALFFFVYGLTFFFSNFGPNTTTYIVPGEAFPSNIRATAHGLSAAAGKLGAIVGVSAFVPVVEKHGVGVAFFGCSIVSLIGLICTIFFVPETKGTDLQVMDEQEAETAGREEEESRPLAH